MPASHSSSYAFNSINNTHQKKIITSTSNLKQNIVNISLLDHLMKQNIINTYCCIIWWPPDESFSLIFQLLNG